MSRLPFLLALIGLVGCHQADVEGGQCGVIPDHWSVQESGLMEWNNNGPYTVSVGNGTVRWAGEVITLETLDTYLDKAGTLQLPVWVELRIEPDADCATRRVVIDMMKRAPVCAVRDKCGTVERWNNRQQLPPPE